MIRQIVAFGRHAIAPALLLSGLVSTQVGCDDTPYCFANCGETASGGSDGVGGQGGAVASIGSGANGGSGGSGGGMCELTNGGVEACDNLDNDCNGQVDEDFEFDTVFRCGTCDNNCYLQLVNTDPNTITCTWSGTPNDPGVCAFTDCAVDYFDLDPAAPGCEYYCVQDGTDDTVCDNKDNDCDGVVDEDVNVCNDAANCGGCGVGCSVVHGAGACVNNGTMPCNTGNTLCEIQNCDDDDNDQSPDWWDLDGSFVTGCEYSCSLTNGGVEICGDGIDNDCDGAIDAADTDLSGDPQIGQVCYGDPDGRCSLPAHAGVTECQGQQVVCAGANVLVENQMNELCNAIDDDCDGNVDDNPTDAGSSCGQSAIFPCTLGTEQCQGGALVCVGAIAPTAEVCNGVDDNCDGMIDLTNGQPPADSMGTCNVPIPPPAGATSPCMPGNLACVGGTVVCQGSVGPTGNDTCNVDGNCDGQLTGQPDTQTDVSNCGGCGIDCYTGSQNSIWSCAAGACQYGGCQPNFYDLNNDQLCEYACTVTGSEVCDGLDNDCNGSVDDGLVAPAPSQVCGVSPVATRPECTTQVTVACTNGTWACTFPANVCGPNCASATEVCDNLDNDCDGSLNENVADFGLACASDDGQPFPGDGACRTTGTRVCNGPNATACSAVAANCSTLPGGCTEVCDGEDNDCDGLVDETFDNKGTNAAFFVQPEVVRVGAALWTYAYESSRPDASAVTAGNGNGYHCSGAGCTGGIPPAPVGTPLNETVSCSVQGRLPWFNVTPVEVEQTCDAVGGFICDTTEWMTACEVTAPTTCTWGYSPRGAACTSSFTGGKFCNLEPFDFNSMVAGNQDGLLPTGSPLLSNCFADWSGLLGNTFTQVHDVTGNLREITKNGTNVYPIMGGAFSSNEGSATCDFDFYVVDSEFELLDTGFRCCFDSDPRL